MDLDQIIILLNNKNIHNLYYLLYKSQCSKAKKLLSLINNNLDFYSALGEIYGPISKNILIIKNLEAIKMLGQYLKINKKIYYNVIRSMIYPILMLLIQVCLLLLLKKVIVFNYYLLLIIFVVVLCYLYYHYIKILRLKNEIIGLYLFQEFTHNQISYLHLIKCFKVLKRPNRIQIEHDNIETLCQYHCNSPFVDRKNFQEFYKKQEKNLYFMLESTPILMKNIFILLSVIICLYIIAHYYSYLNSIIFF